MNATHILSLKPPHAHSSLREGVRLGVIMASASWLWVALVDVMSGRSYHTFAALGGVVAFTVMHFLLNIAYGVTILSAIHGAERAPSLIIAAIFGVLTLEGGI